MIITYMHHADRDMSKGRSQDNPITKLGIKEASAIGEIISTKKTDITCIYTGDYIRYRQTNELINKFVQAPIIVDSRLNEIDCNGKEYERRLHEFLRDIIAKHNNDDMIVCMTSGVALGCFMSFFFKEPIKGFEYAQGATVSPVLFGYDKDQKRPFMNNWKN